MSEENTEISEEDLDKAFESGNGSKVARYALAVLGGLVPFAGGAIGGAAGAWSDHESDQFKKILRMWLQMQQDEVKEIGKTLFEVMDRLDQNDEKIRERIESKEYLSIVKNVSATGLLLKVRKGSKVTEGLKYNRLSFCSIIIPSVTLIRLSSLPIARAVSGAKSTD